MKLGLKLWSTNYNYINHAKELYHEGIYDYIELFVEPNSNDSIKTWKSLHIPYILHAPHSYKGLNFSKVEMRAENVKVVEDVLIFFEELNPTYVIFHPGIEGNINETVNQIGFCRSKFPFLFQSALIENKPKIGIKAERCIGFSYEEIHKIFEDTGMGFCLDFGHAICAAVSENRCWKDYINSFIKLHPKMFHLSDGHLSSPQDEHLHIGTGDFEIAWLLSKIGENDMVSLETIKNSPFNLDDFRKDVEDIKRGKK